MRKTYDLKQVKISTSILWLLNKAQARKVFFSSTDIFSDKSTLQLHSLIIRGLISGELYSAVLSKLFPTAQKIIRNKDFSTIIEFLFELDKTHLEEVSILRQKDRDSYFGSLLRQEPFEMSEHLQMIDAIMAVNLTESEAVRAIPNILGKLCGFRPTTTEPKKLLEIWFKSVTCLTLSQRNIKDLVELIKIIITEGNIKNESGNDFLETIKFSDKLALIISYDHEFIGIEENFLFEYSSDGSADRNSVKHNFMTVLNIFRKKFPKILEDFKELMLVLNSSHVQISNNMLINIDTFMLEFFTSIDEFSNRGNRTFRTGSSNSDVRMEIKGSDKIGSYHSQTVNKPPSYFKDNFSKPNVFGTYSGKRAPPVGIEDPKSKENSMKWESNTPSTNLLSGSRKQSLPVVLDGLNRSRMVNSEIVLPEGSLKSMFIDKKHQNEESDINKTSWLEQLERSQKMSSESSKGVSSDQENMGPKTKNNETRLRLNLKRQEIERNRYQVKQKSAKEMQLLSDEAFKDVTIRSARNDQEENGNGRPKRVSDIKRNKNYTDKKELIRSRSQDISRKNVDEISASLDQLKSEISKLTTEQAKLTARLEDKKTENVELFSPRTEPDLGSRLNARASTRSIPPTWNGRSMYNNEEQFYENYQVEHPRVQYPYSLQYISSTPHPYPYPIEHFQYQQMRYPQEFSYSQYNQPYSARHMAKSVQESTTSRITSPVALSEPPQGFEDVLSIKKEEINHVKLTVNNLIKHNESMEILTHLNLNQDPINGNNVCEEKPNIEEKISEELPKAIVNIEKETSGDVLQAFYVSFNDEDGQETKPNRKPQKPQKPPKPQIVKRNSNQENIPLSKDIQKLDGEKIEVSKPVKKEKPVAFVISVDDEEISKKPTDTISLIKDKLAHLAEKREQERKEKLEKIRESSKSEIEKRIEKEIEKEKIKQEKEMKRKAIFEAYIEKKIENEVNEKPRRKETRLPKRLNRGVSAAPLQRNELDHIINTDPSPPEMQSSFSKADKTLIVPTSTKLFVPPKSKSNKGVIVNAIKYCCLAGIVNEELKHQTIESLEKSEGSHYMVLMRGSCQYRSLYGFNPETEVLVKISGMGPKKITSKMVERFYKYNSGSKKFIEIYSTSHLSTVIDGISIFNTLWKSNVPTGGQLLSSETSSQAEQISQ